MFPDLMTQDTQFLRGVVGIHLGIHWDDRARTRAGGCGLELVETLKEWTAADGWDYPRRPLKEEVKGSNPIRGTQRVVIVLRRRRPRGARR